MTNEQLALFISNGGKLIRDNARKPFKFVRLCIYQYVTERGDKLVKSFQKY